MNHLELSLKKKNSTALSDDVTMESDKIVVVHLEISKRNQNVSCTMYHFGRLLKFQETSSFHNDVVVDFYA